MLAPSDFRSRRVHSRSITKYTYKIFASSWGVKAIEAGTMARTERKSRDGNNSLLQTARTKKALTSSNTMEVGKAKRHIVGRNDVGSRNYATGEKQNVVQSRYFFSLWPTSNDAIDDVQKRQKEQKKDIMIAKKRTMDISEGINFSAPAPMTLNRYQPQMGREKTAIKSKEHREIYTRITQKQQEAQFTVEERLKQTYGMEEIDRCEDGKVNKFRGDDRAAAVNTILQKKTLMKKVLGKVRPNPMNQLQQTQEKSSAIQAAMAAAAAAVEAATRNPNGRKAGHAYSRQDAELQTRPIVNPRSPVSFPRQKKKASPMHDLLHDMFHTPTTDFDNDKLETRDLDEAAFHFHFPINEVTMDPNGDSVSDLDASLSNTTKIPVAEILMSSPKSFHGDDSVSTLGTPRIFEELQNLRRSQRFFGDDVVLSKSTHEMITSRDTRALIDQDDSGTLLGDMTIGTARAENAIQFCNMASHCFHPGGHKSFFLGSSAKKNLNGDSDSSGKEKITNAELWTSPNPAFTQAIEDAIRRAEIKIATNHTRIDPSNTRERIGQITAKSEARNESRLRANQPAKIDEFEELKVNVVTHTNTKATEFENRKSSQMRRTKKTGGISERVLLEKDDAYWDTLSTIASTTDDQSTENDQFMDAFAQTASRGEMKSEISPRSNRDAEDAFSRQSGHLQVIMNDVTDLIDSSLLDNLPIPKNRKTRTEISSSVQKVSNTVGRAETSNVANGNKKYTLIKQMRPRPEGDCNLKLEQKTSGKLTTQIAEGLRSISWEDKKILSNECDEDTTNNSGSSYSIAKISRPNPEGMHRSQRRGVSSGEQYPRAEDDLLSRTLELSKGLLETIMGSQPEQGGISTKEAKELYKSPNGSQKIQCDDIPGVDNQTSTESRDDFHSLEKVREDDFSPTINSRLESLRNQRTRALTKFRQSQLQMSMLQPSRSVNIDGEKRDRERLIANTSSHDYGRYTRNYRDAECGKKIKTTSHQYREDPYFDLKYSLSNSSATPSQKARDLRVQLSEAMRASREIQLSQNELGNKLNCFKSRYYRSPEKKVY